MDSTRRLNLLSTFKGKSLAEQFENDLRFFQLLLVLINKSCPIKSVDLMWKSSEPAGSGPDPDHGDSPSHARLVLAVGLWRPGKLNSEILWDCGQGLLGLGQSGRDQGWGQRKARGLSLPRGTG
jgi:hypothetical protein